MHKARPATTLWRPLLAAAIALAASLACAQDKAPPAVKVLVAPVVKAPLQQTLSLSGTLVSPTSSNLAARVSGNIETLHVDIGDRVKSGQALLTLDKKLASLELQRITAARNEAQILHRDAQRLAQEAKRLAESKHLSQTEYQSRQARAEAASANVKQLNARYAVQTEQLQRHTLRAPFAGVIASKLTEPGQWVNEGGAVFTLAQMDPLHLQVQVPERFFGQLQNGAAITLKAGQQQQIIAQVEAERIVPISSPNTRTFWCAPRWPTRIGHCCQACR